MKKILSASVIGFSLFLGLAQPVSAHILQTNGNIGAVMHIDPDDDPIVGQQAGFFFEFKDKQNKFQPQDCNCTFSINENGKEIFSQDLFANNSSPSLDNASVFYTFPRRDVYQVIVTGQPLLQNEFQPFRLVYEIRVDRGTNVGAGSTSTDTGSDSHFQSYLVIGIACLLIVGGSIIYFLKRQVKRKKHKKDTEENKNFDNVY